MAYGDLAAAKDQERALETYKMMFEMQDRSAARQEALRQHQAAEEWKQREFGLKKEELALNKELKSEAPLPKSEYPAYNIDPNYSGPVIRKGTGGIEMPGKAATQVNIENKGDTGFAKKAGEKVADSFSKISDEGNEARDKVALLTRLDELGSQFDTGGPAAAQAWLSNTFGINIGDNVDKVQAYQAVVDNLAPQQRIPGTGTTSDKDLATFKGSIPSLLKTPEGNALISDTLKSMSQAKIMRAELAERAMAGDMEWREAYKEMRKIDPLGSFKEYQNARKAPAGGTEQPAAAAPSTGSFSVNEKPLRPAPAGLIEAARRKLGEPGMSREAIIEHMRVKGFKPPDDF
jgi:hypothetical protein